jgi:DoxX-like family
MESIQTAPSSKKALWAGRIISALPALFLLMDVVMKLFKSAAVVEETARLGYPDVMFGLGLVLLACVVLYVIPATSVLGAILLTGYLGGAVASHVRVGEGLFPVFFPVIVGVLLWLGLYLRDVRLRSLIPLRR